MPKRSKRSKDRPADPHRAASGATTGEASGLPDGVAVDEKGAFAFARCDRCGWQGAARRSRERARKDLRHHLEDKPKHADHVSLENVTP